MLLVETSPSWAPKIWRFDSKGCCSYFAVKHLFEAQTLQPEAEKVWHPRLIQRETFVR